MRDVGLPGSVLLTGPTGGLGRALLAPLARRQPEHLILLGRAPGPLDAAQQLARDAGARAVSVVDCDLADLDAVASAGWAVTALIDAGYPPLRSMVLNAAVQMTDRHQHNRQGLELTFAVNVVAQHLLLKSTAAVSAPGSHAVIVGSGTHYGDWHSYGMIPRPAWKDPTLLAQPDSDDASPDRTSGGRTYATSKLAGLYLAHAWQARNQGRRRINVFDPGLMPGTGIARGLARFPLFAWNHVMPALTFLPGWSTPPRSAQHLAAFALGEVHTNLSGGYVELGQVRQSSAASYDLIREHRLWRVLEDLTAFPPRTAAGL